MQFIAVVAESTAVVTLRASDHVWGAMLFAMVAP